MKLDIRRYEMYQSLIFLVNLCVFIVGVCIYGLEFGTFGNVIYNETQEWNKTAILDIITSSPSQGCPYGYLPLTGEMLGTVQYCKKSGYYNRGSCSNSKSSSGSTKSASGPISFQIVNKNLTCIKYGELNYFSLVQYRTQTPNSCSTYNPFCGPKDGSLDMSYCTLTDTTCPINKIEMNSNASTSSSHQHIYHDLGSNFKAYLYQDMNYNPIASLSYHLGPLCGDVSQQVSTRIGSAKTYDSGSCTFKNRDNLTWNHPDYLDTGLYANEYEIFQQNSLLDKIRSYVPDFENSDLSSNTYHLYAKPYAMWRSSCEQDYELYYVQEQAQYIKSIQNATFGVFFITGIQLLQFFITISVYWKDFHHHRDVTHKCCAYYTMISSFILFIVMNWLFIILNAEVNTINEEAIQYYIDNNCSSDLMVYSYQKILSELVILKFLAVIGMIMTLGCLILDYWSIVHSFHAQNSLLNCFRRLLGQKVIYPEPIQEPLIQEGYYAQYQPATTQGYTQNPMGQTQMNYERIN